jgi:hypothetical protein
VDLKRGQRGDLERVAYRPGVVRPGTRVQEDRVGVPVEGVQALDEGPLVVGLEEARLQAELAGVGPDPLFELS